MSNLSDIGLAVKSNEEFYELLNKAHQNANPLVAEDGTYLRYTDSSGAELWLQFNKENKFIGFNPHYKGISKRKVYLTAPVERNESELDGALYAWANPADPKDPESGEYPFVFDVPDYHLSGHLKFPQIVELQLAAFTQELIYYENEEDFSKQQTTEPRWASKSFVPSGLFSTEEDNEPKVPEAFGIFVGIIRQAEKKINSLSGEPFFWMLVDTLGGEIDVVADVRFFAGDPQPGGLIHGQFWLSGQLLTTAETIG